MARRTKEQALATRHDILDAAERLFEVRGVSGTSLHDIAEAAGVTRGAVYWHFADKADLFDAMMSRVTLPMEEAFRSGPEAGGDPIASIRRNFLDALRKTVADPQARRVFEIALHKVEYVGELEAVRERRRATRDRCLADVERDLRRALRGGRIGRQLSPRAAAIGLQALIEGLIQNWMLDPEGFDLVRTGGRIIDRYLAGLSPQVDAQPGAAAARPRRGAGQRGTA